MSGLANRREEMRSKEQTDQTVQDLVGQCPGIQFLSQEQ